MNFWRSLILLVGSGLLWSQALALEIKTWTTENGAKVMFVESHDLPMVDIRFTYKAGSARDGEQPGISRLVSALLVEGTGDLDAKQVALQFESVGAQLGHDSLRDMAWTSLRSLSDPAMLDQVVDLYARVNALPSSHLWKAHLPDDLGPGTYTVSVRAVDEFGVEHHGHAILEIAGSSAPAAAARYP